MRAFCLVHSYAGHEISFFIPILLTNSYNRPKESILLSRYAMTKDEILKKHKQYLFPSISTYCRSQSGR